MLGRKCSRFVSSVAFSLSGGRVRSSSGDNTIEIWDAAMQVLIPTFEKHYHGVNSLAILSDARNRPST